MITEIKKGDRFRCAKDVVMNANENILFNEGREYVSEQDNCITNNEGETNHWWTEKNQANLYFTRIDPDTQQDLTREAIEQDEVEKSVSDRMKDVEREHGLTAQINWNKITENYNKVEETIKQRQFDTGSIRDKDDNKPLVNHIDPYTRLRFGYHLRSGASHYGKGNWRLGQPTEAAIECIGRHLAKYELNAKHGVEQDEDHLSALIFNIQLIMMNEEKEGITVDHFYKNK